MKLHLALICATFSLLASAMSTPKIDSATLAADGQSATLAISTDADGLVFRRSEKILASALGSDSQSTLATLLDDLGELLPEGFTRGAVVVERGSNTLPAIYEDEVLVAPEAPAADVSVYGSHPTLGNAVISTTDGTLTVTREQHAAILALLDEIESSLAAETD